MIKKLFLSLNFLLLLLPMAIFANANCQGPYQGQSISAERLKALLSKTQKDRHPLNLCGTLLSHLNLSNMDLQHVNLSYADLSETNLSGANLSNANLQRAFLRWANLKNTNFDHANLNLADLQDAQLDNASFKQADLSETNFHGTTLIKADLRGTNLQQANFTNANLTKANLTWSDLSNAKFSHAILAHADLSHSQAMSAQFDQADLTQANFSQSFLKKANFQKAILAKANFSSADIQQATYQPTLNQLPILTNLATAKNFRQLEFYDKEFGAPALGELRMAYHRLGSRQMERLITSMIKEQEMRQAWQRGGWGYLEASFNYLFFYITSDFGLMPGRPLLIFLSMIFLFSFIYYGCLLQRNNQAGIHFIWPKKNKQQSHLYQTPYFIFMPLNRAPIFLGLKHNKYFLRLYGLSLFFSLLTAFQIGWHDLNLSHWISRIQPREFSLKPYGWTKVIAGLQSLISVYLLVLWALTYFGQPFQW